MSYFVMFPDDEDEGWTHVESHDHPVEGQIVYIVDNLDSELPKKKESFVATNVVTMMDVNSGSGFRSSLFVTLSPLKSVLDDKEEKISILRKALEEIQLNDRGMSESHSIAARALKSISK